MRNKIKSKVIYQSIKINWLLMIVYNKKILNKMNLLMILHIKRHFKNKMKQINS